jgi:hypothetical protein
VYDASTGKAVANAIDLNAGISSFAVGDRFFAVTDTGGAGYEIRRIGIGQADQGTVLNSVNNRYIADVALCGTNLLCVLDGIGQEVQVSAIDIEKGGEVWRHPAAGARKLVTVGDRILALNPYVEGPVSYLFDPAGKQLLSAEDQKRLAVRTSGTGLLLFDGLLETKVRDVIVRGIDPATGTSNELGELTQIVPGACSWTQRILSCPQARVTGDAAFMVWRFAAQ